MVHQWAPAHHRLGRHRHAPLGWREPTADPLPRRLAHPHPGCHLTRDATSGTSSQARGTTDSDGGLFDVVDRARKRLEDARGDAPREPPVGAAAAGSRERASTPPATRSSPRVTDAVVVPS